MNNNAEGRVAVESNRVGAGGDRLLAQITGLDAQDDPAGTKRTGWGACGATGAASSSAWWRSAPRRKKDPALEGTLAALVQPETAGDPMSEQKWVRSSLRHLVSALTGRGTSCESTNGGASVT